MARTGSPVHPRAGLGARARITGASRAGATGGIAWARARTMSGASGLRSRTGARGTPQGQHGPTLAGPGSLRGEGPGYLSHSIRSDPGATHRAHPGARPERDQRDQSREEGTGRDTARRLPY